MVEGAAETEVRKRMHVKRALLMYIAELVKAMEEVVFLKISQAEKCAKGDLIFNHREVGAL